MHVFRGPKENPGYPHTQLVDVKDLSRETRAWTGEKFLQFQVSKETALQRRAVAHIRLTEADVLALYAGLVKGWRKQLKALEREGKGRE